METHAIGRLVPVIALFALAACGTAPVTPSPGPLKNVDGISRVKPEDKPRDRTRIRAQNVALRLSSTVEVLVPYLSGELQGVDDHMADLSDPETYAIVVYDAELRVAGSDLGALMESTLAEDGTAPIRDLRVEVRADSLVLRGTIQRPIPIQATITGTLHVTGEGVIELQPTAVEAAGLPVGNLLDLFGVDLADAFRGRKGRGFWFEGDRLLLEPQRIMQRPKLRGRVFRVRTEPGRLVLFMDSVSGVREEAALEPPEAAKNYFFIYGGDVRIGSFVVEGADLLLRDGDPSDRFDLNLSDYRTQVIAGSLDFLPDMGMVVRVPDYGDVARRKAH